MTYENVLQFTTTSGNRNVRRKFSENTTEAAINVGVGFASTAAAVATSPSELSVEELYPEMSAIRPEIVIATGLLDSGLADLNNALALSNENQTILADDAIQRFEATLPELFACRVVGDGFAAVTNALVHGLDNRQGELLSAKQIQTLRTVVTNLRKQPFLSFDDAIDSVMEMESAGFIVEPQGFEALADWLINE